MQYNFEWDLEKSVKNRKKHNISFEHAATIFRDPRSLTIYDKEHSLSIEDRWISMGLSINGILLVVIHTYEEEKADYVRIRIISARKATKNEKKQYQGE